MKNGHNRFHLKIERDHWAFLWCFFHVFCGLHDVMLSDITVYIKIYVKKFWYYRLCDRKKLYLRSVHTAQLLSPLRKINGSTIKVEIVIGNQAFNNHLLFYKNRLYLYEPWW